ncbi:hypothetical protein BAUCODRAFT_549935 [Baudoinia panamericana UAMH 10762]|uniref:Uncharacterized protein n=1 Tax=Baudoinia panamericana (strain UAMH 10762) TaxID=717646 RepID=M2LJW3_BAUPA|nr:uncharacterized protein BAUCODRAFT_549935 [Baudoinia panamericana UAMH 10762]EMC94497.1 hypothetical protein BAUCODRAFT_549935 [Baudoinia panamericana UAMH 10762]
MLEHLSPRPKAPALAIRRRFGKPHVDSAGRWQATEDKLCKVFVHCKLKVMAQG